MIDFDPVKHIYSVGNKEVPSVTTVLSSIGTWREAGGFESLSGKTHFMDENSRAFGTALHATIDLYNKGSLGEYDPLLEPWLNGYKKFLKSKKNWTIIASEKRVYSERYCYAGTIDLIMMDTKSNLWIIDYKSGLFQQCHNMQTSAYDVAYREMHKMRPGPTKNRTVLQLMENDFKIHLPNRPNDFNLFLSALNIYKHLNK